jgi:hypothetical protein
LNEFNIYWGIKIVVIDDGSQAWDTANNIVHIDTQVEYLQRQEIKKAFQ